MFIIFPARLLLISLRSGFALPYKLTVFVRKEAFLYSSSEIIKKYLFGAITILRLVEDF